MVASFFLSLREGLEAALVIGIVLGALRRMNRDDLVPAVWRGAGLAVLISILAAAILTALGAQFEGRAEEIFEGIAMLLAAGILTWMIFWMQRQSSKMRQKIENRVQKAAFNGGQAAVFTLALAAVVREGIELALFLTAAGMAAGTNLVLPGAVLGLITAAAAGWLLFTGTRKLNVQAFFRITNILLLLFAAGLVAHGVHELNEAGIIPAVIEDVWNLNPILDEDSTLGALMKALFGYNGNPSLTEVFAYGGYMVTLAGFLSLAGKRSKLSSETA